MNGEPVAAGDADKTGAPELNVRHEDMKEINPNSFPGRMLQPLDELAHQLLGVKNYPRLKLVSELLATFSQGAWSQLEEDVKRQILRQLQQDFHTRAWDDWEWSEDSPYGRIHAIISAEQKAMDR